ncbi:altered inheritance of mitochondria protein 3 [Folsomia candida]|uniref:altered inheritance of mitochondria protein 3 n=1 Tax=Folsomia candida TaxID=158441 RepID=UPI000B90371B|nr:altered inheritance of mitochondria protein 3 [Folsomia candida]
MKTHLLLLFVGVAHFCGTEGKRRRVFFREVTPTTSDAIIRSQRGIITSGYGSKVIEQHAAATRALEEATTSEQATQFLAENLQNSIKLRQQLGTQQVTYTPGPIRLVDQYGNEVMHGQQPAQENRELISSSHSQPAGPPQIVRDPVTPGPQNAYLPPAQTQPPQQPQQLYYQPQYQYFHQPPVLQSPLLQQFVTPEGHVFHQFVEQQPQHQSPPQQVYYHTYQQPHLVTQPEPVQYYHPPQTPHISILAQPPVEVDTVVQQQPILPVKELSTTKVVKQSILSPAVFQKEIFAIKNPPVSVLTYSDLCTVYPYQRKLSACVYKKAAIPELHHPDIQLVIEQKSAPQVREEGGYGEGQLNPRTQPLLRLNVPKSDSTTTSSTVGGDAGSIQDILGRGKKNSLSPVPPVSSEEQDDNDDDPHDPEIAILEEESTNIAESSNKKEKLVIKTTKHSPQTSTTTSTTTTTTTPPSSTTRKPKKSKRRSRNNSSKRRRDRKNKEQSNNNSSSISSSTDRMFKLA